MAWAPSAAASNPPPASTDSARALVETARSMITAPPVELPEPQPVGGHDHRPVLMGAVRGSERRQQRCQPGAVRHHRRQVGRGQIRLSGSQQPTEREGESAARRTEQVLVVAPGETDPPVLRAVDALDRGDVIGQTGERRVDRTAQMPGCSRPDCDAEKGSHELTRSMDTVVDSPVLCERRIHRPRSRDAWRQSYGRAAPQRLFEASRAADAYRVLDGRGEAARQSV